MVALGIVASRNGCSRNGRIRNGRVRNGRVRNGRSVLELVVLGMVQVPPGIHRRPKATGNITYTVVILINT